MVRAHFLLGILFINWIFRCFYSKIVYLKTIMYCVYNISKLLSYVITFSRIILYCTICMTLVTWPTEATEQSRKGYQSSSQNVTKWDDWLHASSSQDHRWLWRTSCGVQKQHIIPGNLVKYSKHLVTFCEDDNTYFRLRSVDCME
jgi:hypothetical protein